MRLFFGKKTLIINVILLAILLQPISIVSAQNLNTRSLQKEVNSMQDQASKAATESQRKLSDVIQKADTLIANRLSKLNTLSARIQSDTKLSSDEKNSLSSDIQTAITGLTALKAKIDADTDVETALTDAKQIFTNFRVYEVLEPKIRILITLDNIQMFVTNVQNLAAQLQTLITTLSSQGKDVSQLTSLLSDINSQLQTMSTTIAKDQATVESITVSTINPQTTFTQIRTDIQTFIKTDIQKVRQDFEQMRTIFMQLIKTAKPTGETLLQTTPTATSSTSAQ